MKSKMNKCSLIELKMYCLIVHEMVICHIRWLRRFIWQLTVLLTQSRFPSWILHLLLRNVASDYGLQSAPQTLLWWATIFNLIQNPSYRCKARLLKFRKKTKEEERNVNSAHFHRRSEGTRLALLADGGIGNVCYTPAITKSKILHCKQNGTGLSRRRKAVKHLGELFMTFWSADFCT